MDVEDNNSGENNNSAVEQGIDWTQTAIGGVIVLFKGIDYFTRKQYQSATAAADAVKLSINEKVDQTLSRMGQGKSKVERERIELAARAYLNTPENELAAWLNKEEL